MHWKARIDPIELKKIANFTIKPFLSQVDGVSEVRVIGGKEEKNIELNSE
jgi:multidrug efflux pump subunit AcrB